jgi:hypothetical protein
MLLRARSDHVTSSTCVPASLGGMDAVSKMNRIYRWLNPLLDRTRFFRGMEWLLGRVGVQPTN